MVSINVEDLIRSISNLTQENVRLERENSELKRRINILTAEKVINDHSIVDMRHFFENSGVENG